MTRELEEKIFLVDVDYCVVPLHGEWYARYNRDYNDNLTTKKVTEWDISKFVKPECGKNIYTYLQDVDLYDNIKIPTKTVKAIQYIKTLDNLKVVFLSAGIHIGKYNLLKRYGLVSSERDIIIASDKSLVFGDIMVDDYEENIFAFQRRNPKGFAMLYDANHNRSVEMTRVRNWEEIVSLLTTRVI
jgi:5'(3')-deoxyribonucleotidase